MQDKFIKIRGARVHNLKNIDLDIPINKISCFYGPSGSGKSSLAFHTLFAESKRRFLNSFPTYLKFFSDRPAPADVDSINPVLPVFALPQINPIVGTRSNVADIMQLTGLLQSHFFHFSRQICPIHKTDLASEKISSLVENMVDEDGINYIFMRGDEFKQNFSNMPFPSRSIRNQNAKKVDEFNEGDEFWEILRFKAKTREALDKKLLPYLDFDLFLFNEKTGKIKKLPSLEKTLICPALGCEIKGDIRPKLLQFSPYNPIGACHNCGGFGEVLDYDEEKLFDINKSVQDGAILFLKYKRFISQDEYLKKEMKKKKISLVKPLKELEGDFWDLLYHGSGMYVGFEEIFQYLESKKYKMSVRIFIRNIQKATKCKECDGTRMNPRIKNFILDSKEMRSLHELLQLNLRELKIYFEKLQSKNRSEKKSLAKISKILTVANNLGLSHLSILRKTKSLSAGEYQRLLLLKYLSYEGTGSLFILDEPSLGLSLLELKALYDGFRDLIKMGNTVILVEHNEFLIEKSDYIFEMGPSAGHLGGKIIFQGDKKRKNNLNDVEPLKKINLTKKKDKIVIRGGKIFGKEFNSTEVVLDAINLVKGSSGTGKTSLIINILGNELNYRIHGEYLNIPKGSLKEISCSRKLNDVIIVNSNLNRYTSRSTVGSLTGLFPVVRKHFLNLPISKSMNLKDGHFSSNSELGQCPKCEGRGVLVVEMQFLEDIILTCEDCKGKKLKERYVSISDGYMNVHQAFTNPLSEVLDKIKLTPKFQRIYQYIKLLNLDYLSLDRPINSLSGGERQRIYLLSKVIKSIENSLIILENISFGLSQKELVGQIKFIQDLLVKKNTVVIIDQHPFFEEISNNIIELGLE